MYRSMLVILLLVLSSFQISVMSLTDMHVMKAAEGQLGIYIARIPPGEATSYGFRQEDDKDLLVVEKPYRFLEFNEDFYSYDLSEDKNYILIKNEWKVPVSIKGVNRVLLTVKGNSSNYTISGMGDTMLAKELQHKNIGVSDSEEYYLLRIPALSAAFFGHEGTNSFMDIEFIPLASAINAIASISKVRKDSYSLGEVQQMVKEELVKRAKKETVKTQPKKNAPKKKTKSTPVKIN